MNFELLDMMFEKKLINIIILVQWLAIRGMYLFVSISTG